MTLNFNLPEKMFQMALFLLKENNGANCFEIQTNVEVMARTNSDRWSNAPLTFKCDHELQPTLTNISDATSTHQGEQLCQIILIFMHKCRSYGQDKYRRMHACTSNAYIHITHTPNRNCDNYVSFTSRGLDKKSSVLDFSPVSQFSLAKEVLNSINVCSLSFQVIPQQVCVTVT